MSAPTEARETIECPECGTVLPVEPGYVTWCHACEWNLRAPETPPTPGRVGRLIDSTGRRLGDRLAKRLVAAGRLEPKLTPARVGAYAVAFLVHALWIGLIAGGIALAVVTWLNPFALAVALFMVAAGILMRPGFGELPEEGIRTPDEAPALWALADEVADALGTKRADVVAVHGEFNASWGVLGLRRRRVLQLGAPLLAGLEPQERVALVAHELAHARNGDSARGLFVGSALTGLAQLYVLLSPDEEVGGGGDFGLGFAAHLANGALWVLSRPVLGLYLLELGLVMRDSQRAEFLADALAADVAGTDAAVRLEEKVLLAPTFLAAVQHAVHGDRPDELLADVAAAFTAVPERERERRRRVARLEASRLAETHPPTAHRIRLLEQRPRREPRVVLSGARAEAVQRDLDAVAPTIGRRLVDEHRDRLYY